jgi:Na+-transporting NADH:ubiquinone oxidoreductase subunit NqrE
MEDKLTSYTDRKLAEDHVYNAGYQEGWQDAINYVIDISKQMRYNNLYIKPTLEELEQRIV